MTSVYCFGTRQRLQIFLGEHIQLRMCYLQMLNQKKDYGEVFRGLVSLLPFDAYRLRIPCLN